jgi:hypothetical protein
MKWFVIFFVQLSVFGQYFDTISLSNKIQFIHYLKKQHQTADAHFLLKHINSKIKSDTLQLLEAKLLFEMGRSREAETLLKQSDVFIADSSSHMCSYRFLLNHALLIHGSSEHMLEPVCNNHPYHRELWRIQLLASSVLRNRGEDFHLLFASQKSADPILSLIELDLYIYNREQTTRRKKRPFLAGTISAMLPGAGKIYAGKPHEALNAFLPVIFNGLQAGEGYYHRKWQSPHLYVFGSIGAVFYASNILGSAKAAKRKNQEFENKLKANVEFEISKLIRYY